MQPTRRSTLFLLELMMAILFFCLAAAICVQIFVKSHTIEKESNNLSQAVFVSTSVAEIFRNSDNYSNLLSDEFPHILSENGSYTICFDQNWNSCTSLNASYSLQLETTTEDSFEYCTITVSHKSEIPSVIYQLDVKKYVPQEDSL